jgi:hypothetical protein
MSPKRRLIFYGLHPLPHTPPRLSAQLVKHRDNFTFTTHGVIYRKMQGKFRT